MGFTEYVLCMGVVQPNLELIKKIAALDAQGVSVEQISMAVGVTREHVYALQGNVEYVKYISEAKLQYLEKDKKFDDAWDNVEERALNVIQDNLKYNRDPMFALKAAMLANKAERRGHVNNKPIGQNGNAPKAVITLNQTFITKLQHAPIRLGNALKNVTTIEGETNKAVNMLSPGEVEQMLLKPDPVQVSAPKIENVADPTSIVVEDIDFG